MDELSRRTLLGGGALAAGALLFPLDAAAQNSAQPDSAGPYTLAPLPYDYADLEPHISAQVMKLHHDIHHAGYVRGANDALAALELARRVGGDEIRRVRAATDALAFNLAGHVLHSIFWGNMAKGAGGAPASDSEIDKLVRRDFGSFEAFVAHFSAAAAQVQGNGWSILAYEPLAQRLIVLQAEKHQVNVAALAIPLLVLDVWEHAYYLQFQHMRSNYIKSFFNVVNWPNVDQRLANARKLIV